MHGLRNSPSPQRLALFPAFAAFSMSASEIPPAAQSQVQVPFGPRKRNRFEGLGSPNPIWFGLLEAELGAAAGVDAAGASGVDVTGAA